MAAAAAFAEDLGPSDEVVVGRLNGWCAVRHLSFNMRIERDVREFLLEGHRRRVGSHRCKALREVKVDGDGNYRHANQESDDESHVIRLVSPEFLLSWSGVSCRAIALRVTSRPATGSRVTSVPGLCAPQTGRRPRGRSRGTVLRRVRRGPCCE